MENEVFFIILLLIVVISTLARYYFYKKYNQLQKKILFLLQQKDLPIFYSSDFIKSEIIRKFLHLKPHRYIALSKMAIKNPLPTRPLVAKNIVRFPHHKKLLLLYAELNILANDYATANHSLECIKNPHLLSRSLKAKYLYLKAKCEIFETDMQSAAAHLAHISKFYQKNKKMYAYEQADVIFALAQIYRITGLSDAAFNLFLDARKIYQELNLPHKEAETNAYIGLLEMSNAHYDTSYQYLHDAAAKTLQFRYKKTYADICNWIGMLHFIKKDLSKAKKYFNKAYYIGSKAETKAFAADMLARWYIAQKKDNEALQYTKQALDYNTEQNYIAGIFENLYLRAEIYYNRQDFTQSKKILTSLIKNYRSHTAVYYLSNAYTLLGLIELKQNNLDQAQSLFKEALDLEHAQNRLKGAAIDYNNLAELAILKNNQEEAKKYFEQALAHAEEIDDKELIDYFKSKLN